MEKLINRQYVGARYVPKIMGEWNKALQYEALSIVTHLGNSFTSKVPVPANIDINNENYWVSTGNYNAQVENYRQETATVSKLLTEKTTYYTPEMFGAKGDGVSDDTNAIQTCLNKIADIKGAILMTGNYFITSPVTISGAEIKILGNGNITYIGDDYAIKIHKCTDATIFFGSIYSTAGGGILFYNTSANDYNQYVNLYINKITAKTTCIKSITHDGSWNNEIRIYNTRLSTFDYTAGQDSKGIHIVANNNTNGWRIENVGFEQINYGLVTEISGDDRYCECEIISPRMSENFDKIIKTTGGAYIQIISENRFIRDTFFELSDKTSGQIIGKYCNDDYGTISHIARISNGAILVGESIPHYKYPLPNSTDTFDVRTKGANNIITDFVLRNSIKYTIKLSDYYSNLSINEFRVEVENSNVGLIIKDSNDKVLFSKEKLIGNSIYNFHFVKDELFYSCSELYPNTPIEISANTLTLSNCTIDDWRNHNGYRVNGNLINVTLVVNITAAGTATISGLPIPCFNAEYVPILCNCSNGDAEINGSTGILTIKNATANAAKISAMYFGVV
jgi:hypothetical protein